MGPVVLGRKRNLPFWLLLGDQSEHLGQLRFQRPVNVIVGPSLVVYDDVVALDGEDPRPRAVIAI